MHSPRVVGGGNSGLEVAGLVKRVMVLEFASQISADAVLKTKAEQLNNVTLIANAQTTAISGSGRVNGLTYTDRATGTAKQVPVEGVFVQIGLVPNTDFVKETVKLDAHHQIVIDKHGATSMAHVYAAGDCTDSLYKQIVIAMSSGAASALSAFSELAFG